MKQLAIFWFNKFFLQKKFIILLGFVGILVIYLIFYFPYYTKLKNIRQENENLLEKMHQVASDIRDYQAKSKTIQKDPFLLEKVAREDLGVAKEEEIVVDIKD